MSKSPPVAIDYVSPLPPVRSGVADYSVDLLPELARRTDVRVVALPGQEPSAKVVEEWHPVGLDRLGEEGRLPLYQMGNNVHHLEVFRAAIKSPGVLTLHDLLLHHFLVERTLGVGDYQAYEEQLRADHGWIGAKAALPRRWGGEGLAALFSLPANRDLLRSQRGVLVHNDWARDRIMEDDPNIRVKTVPMGIPLPEQVSQSEGLELRKRLGIPVSSPVLGSFGFQTPIKRTEVLVRALGRPGLENAHLLVVGEVPPVVPVEKEAESAGVRDRVHLLGFVPSRDFQVALSACDLCLNLRYPSAGETSAALLRVLAAGRGAVVSDYAQFVGLPAEVAAKAPLGDDEVPALAAILVGLFSTPERIREMGEAARAYVAREHDPGRAADAVIQACAQWRDAEPLDMSPLRVSRPTSMTWGQLPSRLEVSGWEPKWAGGELRTIQIRLVNEGAARWLPGDEPGGILVEVRLVGPEGDVLDGRPWLPLPTAVDPGGDHVFTVAVRRPLGASWLYVEPHVVGGFGFDVGGTSTWAREV